MEKMSHHSKGSEALINGLKNLVGDLHSFVFLIFSFPQQKLFSIRTPFRYFFLLGTLFSVLFFVQSCANLPKSPQGLGNHLSSFEKKEIEIGNQIDAQVLSSFYLYTEPHLGDYVNHVNALLACHAERKNIKYRVTILLSEKIFATSAPGGHIYITTGFLNFLENEAQLAGVLAHEVGQLQYKNPRLSRSKRAIEAMSVGSSFVGGFFGDIGVLAMLGLRAVDALTDEKSKEARVYSADQLALDYLAEAGYDPESWLDVLEKLSQLKEQNVIYILDYYGNRPITQKRFPKLKSKFKKMEIEGKSLETRRQVYLDATHGVREIYRVSSKI